MKALMKLVAVLVLSPLGLLLLAALPLGAFALLSFVAGEVMAMVVAPAIALYLFGFCLPVGVYQWFRVGKPSDPARLPKAAWIVGGAVAAAAAGQLILLSGNRGLSWLPFLLAGLPPLAALALALQRLGPITSWRRLLAGLISGSVLSVHLTLLLGAGVSALAYLLVLPLREFVSRAFASPSLEGLFYSPALVLAMVEFALVAPVVEELSKPLGALLLARRLRSPAEAFLVGMAGGVGFAILENLLYQSGSAEAWPAIATLRGIGGALHPLNAGLVAVGWYGVRRGEAGAWRRWLGLYGLAVGLHALWNGSQVLLYSGLGLRFFGAESWQLAIYGLAQPGVVVALLVLESMALWRLLFLVTGRLRGPDQLQEEALLELRLERTRRLALWAGGALLLVVPVSMLYGPLLARWLELASPFR